MNEPVRPPREVRALPVVAVCVVMLTMAVLLVAGRHRDVPRAGTSASAHASERHADEPVAVTDVDHYVPGSPPAVAERFLRAWMRARYDEAAALATGPMRARAEQEQGEIAAFNAAQMEELRQTRAFTAATSYDLDHATVSDLPASSDGVARKEVRGEAHAYGTFQGQGMASRRGQTFVMAMTDGAWRVVERTWDANAGPVQAGGVDGGR